MSGPNIYNYVVLHTGDDGVADVKLLEHDTVYEVDPENIQKRAIVKFCGGDDKLPVEEVHVLIRPWSPAPPGILAAFNSCTISP